MAVHFDEEAAIARAHAEDRRQVERLAVRILLERGPKPLVLLGGDMSSGRDGQRLRRSRAVQRAGSADQFHSTRRVLRSGLRQDVHGIFHGALRPALEPSFCGKPPRQRPGEGSVASADSRGWEQEVIDSVPSAQRPVVHLSAARAGVSDAGCADVARPCRNEASAGRHHHRKPVSAGMVVKRRLLAAADPSTDGTSDPSSPLLSIACSPPPR